MAGLKDVVDLERRVCKKQKVDSGCAFEERQASAFQLERERKASRVKVSEVKVEAMVTKFLKHVVEGEQDQAEALLKEMPGLTLAKGDVTDLSQREFKQITGFQYAVWALDWHMWQMLLKYLRKEDAVIQLAELEEKGTAHGKECSWVLLIEALKAYAAMDEECHQALAWASDKCDAMKRHWRQVIGGYQLGLPVHVVNEYCHPTRPFYPCPRFDEAVLPRTRKLEGTQGEWFTGQYYGKGKLGETFAMVRYNLSAAHASKGGEVLEQGAYTTAHGGKESAALERLWEIRQQQREDLTIALHDWMEIKNALNVHFPPVLSSTLLEYLG